MLICSSSAVDEYLWFLFVSVVFLLFHLIYTNYLSCDSMVVALES